MGVTVAGLIVRTGGKTLLDGVDCTLREGRICVVLGPNGAGKSTLLKVLAGLTMPVSGTMTADGDMLAGLDARARARILGYLPQDYRLAWDIMVPQIVRLGRFPHPSDRESDRQIVAEAMAATDTGRFADRTSATLSGGELARVMLARLIAGQHRYWLADEPLASLDPAYQIDIADRLRGVAEGGTGIMLVLHDVTLAQRLADDVLMLKAGRVHASGRADQVLTADNLASLYDVPVAQRPDGSFALG